MSNVYQMVTDRIVEQMNNGRIPWHKPWSCEGDGHDVAINYVTRHAYSVLNQWLLGEAGEYLSFKQINELGGKVKKGAKSRMVVFYTVVKPKNAEGEEAEDEKGYPILRYYNVFHIKDTEGIESKLDAEPKVRNTDEVIEVADAAIRLYVESQKTLTFQHNKPSDRAYYQLSNDTVVVPMFEQYKEAAEYYSTAFHELIHSTMTEARCDRRQKDGISFFGSKAYSREELVAEVGAAMLCSNYGIDSEKAFRNSVAYLQSWASHLKEDPRAIVTAASKAEKAARFIISAGNI